MERTEGRKTRLLIADDHTLVLEGLKRILDTDFDLVGMAENGRDLLRKAEELKPDVVLVDISMPMLNGIDATKQLLKIYPQMKVSFVTMHAGRRLCRRGFPCGGVRIPAEAVGRFGTGNRDSRGGEGPLLRDSACDTRSAESPVRDATGAAQAFEYAHLEAARGAATGGGRAVGEGDRGYSQGFGENGGIS